MHGRPDGRRLGRNSIVGSGDAKKVVTSPEDAISACLCHTMPIVVPYSLGQTEPGPVAENGDGL